LLVGLEPCGGVSARAVIEFVLYVDEPQHTVSPCYVRVSSPLLIPDAPRAVGPNDDVGREAVLLHPSERNDGLRLGVQFPGSPAVTGTRLLRFVRTDVPARQQLGKCPRVSDGFDDDDGIQSPAIGLPL